MERIEIKINTHGTDYVQLQDFFEAKKKLQNELDVLLEKLVHLYEELMFDLEERELTHEGKKKLLRVCFYIVCFLTHCVFKGRIYTIYKFDLDLSFLWSYKSKFSFKERIC